MIVTTKLEPDGLEIVEYDRAEFLEEVWEYDAGERVTILGPSGSGKTTLGYELLQQSATPDLQAIVLVMKGRDDTAEAWNKKLGFRRIRTWPPPLPNPLTGGKSKPPGYTLWPGLVPGSIRETNARLAVNFSRAMYHAYESKKKFIIFADELAGLDDELRLEEEIKMLYARGRSHEAGIMGGTQRPVDIPQLAYSSADHLFLSHDPDERDRRRFGEIGGGVDPKIIGEITLHLDQYWWLYVRRVDRSMCIIRA